MFLCTLRYPGFYLKVVLLHFRTAPTQNEATCWRRIVLLWKLSLWNIILVKDECTEVRSTCLPDLEKTLATFITDKRHLSKWNAKILISARCKGAQCTSIGSAVLKPSLKCTRDFPSVLRNPFPISFVPFTFRLQRNRWRRCEDVNDLYWPRKDGNFPPPGSLFHSCSALISIMPSISSSALELQ